MIFYYTPPEFLQDMVEKAESTTSEQPPQKPVPLNRLQMEMEAKRLLHFYMWHLFANNEKLSFPEIVREVNLKFRGLISENYIARFLLNNKKLGGDSFFECSYTKFKDRFTHFLRYSLKKKLICLKYSFKKPNNIIDFLYYKELCKKRIRDIELESLMDPKLSYRANKNSPFWSLYQLHLDKGTCLAQLIALFPDENSLKIYE